MGADPNADPNTFDGVVKYFDIDAERVSATPLAPEELRVVRAISRKIGGREALIDLLDFLAESLRKMSPCDRFGLAFIEDDGRRLRAHHIKAFYEPLYLAAGYSEYLAGSTLETVLKRGVPRVINDLQRYHELKPGSQSTELLLREGVRSSLTCPLCVDGRNIGVLFRSSRQPNAYDERQVLVQLAVAERLGQAVEKAYRIEQLTEANRAYNEMLTFVTHELRAPLASLLTDANLLLEGYLGPMPTPQLDRIRKLHGKGQHLMTLIHDYLELARLEGGQLHCDPRSDLDFMYDVLRPAVEIVQPQADFAQMRLERDVPYGMPHVELDPRLIKIVLVNLLSNAVKYGRNGGEIHVAASHDGERLLVTIRNDGQGFSSAERTKLFRRFTRLGAAERAKQAGSGIGLYTCWRILQLHGGRIDARSEPGAWAEFSFELPQPLTATLPPLE